MPSSRMEESKARLASALDLDIPDKVPIVIPTYACEAYGSPKPDRYFDHPRIMLNYQTWSNELHVKHVDDDLIPYVVPSYGSGVVASSFGCKIRFPGDSDPYVEGPCVSSLSDIEKLEQPDPYHDGLMPVVLKTIDYMRKNTGFPVSIHDIMGPLANATLICGHSRLYMGMYRRKDLIHKLFDILTKTIIDWIRIQKDYTGEEMDETSVWQRVWLPEGNGIGFSEDEATNLGPELYKEFVVPSNSAILREFNRGGIHFCGNAIHNCENFVHTEGLALLRINPIGDMQVLRELRSRVGDRICIIAGDFTPVAIEEYYSQVIDLFSPFRGVVLVSEPTETIALSGTSYVNVKRDPVRTARRILDFFKKAGLR